MDKENESADVRVNLQRPSGTRDFLPEEMYVRTLLSTKIRSHFELFGFEEVSIPLYDFFKLYEIRSGEKIINDIFTFTDPPKHQDEKNPTLYAIRPEFTAPICRFYIYDKPSHATKPVKFYYIGNCFRYDEPSPGRYREFWQAGCELFGAAGIEADIEILVIAMSLMKSLSLKSYLLRLNDLTILRAYLSEIQMNDEMQRQVFGLIDKYSSLIRKVQIGAMGNQTVDEFEADFQKDCRTLFIDEPIIDILTSVMLLEGNAESVMNQLTQVFANHPKTLEAVQASGLAKIYVRLTELGYGDKAVIDCGIARGLDYYTNTVFEIDIPALGKEKQVCGGGRYDKLIEEFGGEKTPATGFAFGFDRLLIAMEKEGLIQPPKSRADVLIAAKQGSEYHSMRLAEELRQKGIRVETDLMERSFKNASKYVNAMKIPFLIFIGPKEVESGHYTLKNFETTDQVEGLSAQQIADIILKK